MNVPENAILAFLVNKIILADKLGSRGNGPFDLVPIGYPPFATAILKWLHSPTALKDTIMTARLNFYTASPDATKAMIAFESAVHKLGLEPSLLELVKLRASQLNGCAYCVDLHTTDARKAGETERRLHGVSVWRETPFFTERERAALGWTESITQLSLTHAPDEDYAYLKAHFSDKEMVDLTLAISMINSWNRFAVGFRKQPAQ
jgi:AhpD family alkylhydroperoxidase